MRALAFVGLASCTALIGLPDLPDAASNIEGGPDALADATDATDGNASCAAIASVGNVPTETGLSMQSHVVFAQNASTWWLFYIDDADPITLKTRYSTDFCNWSDGADFTLLHVHGNEGRNFAVTYTNHGSEDIVHISFSHLVDPAIRYHTHTRARITGASTIVFDSSTTVSSYMNTTTYPIDPDGPVSVVGSDGFVTDMSGWVDEGNGHIADATMWRSTTADNVTNWTNAWGAFDVVTFVSNVVNARAAVPLATGNILGAWENGSQEPDPNNVGYSVWNGTTWSAAGTIFGSLTQQGVDDWALLAMSPTDVHAVRRTISNGFEHVRFDGTSWALGAPMTPDAGALDTGVFLAGTANNVAAYAIASDQKTIRSAMWNGTSWTAWSTLHTSVNTCGSLSGYASPVAGKAALIWTELAGQGYEIHGAQLL